MKMGLKRWHSFGPLEEVICDLCGSSDAVRVCLQKNTLSSDDVFWIVRCKNCGFMYSTPRPSKEWWKNFLSYTDSWLLSEGKEIPHSFDSQKKYSKSYLRIIALLKRFAPGKRIVDVGCGAGFFVELAIKNGFDAIGCDIRSYTVNDGKKRGCPLFEGELWDLKLAPQSIDAIILWNVLEHMREPKKTLKEAYRILKVGGCILVEVPNNELWYILQRTGIRKTGIYQLQAWNHINHFTQDTLRKLFKICGFSKSKFYVSHNLYFSYPKRFILFFESLLFYISLGKINLYFPLFAIFYKDKK